MKRVSLLLLVLFLILPLYAQNQSVNSDEILTFVGMKLTDLIETFGPPAIVATARGNEVWQDDVVFQYTRGDFYIFRDRVWQIKTPAALGVSLGDSKAAAKLVLGNMTEDNGDHLLLPVSNKDWPLMMRVNINNSGNVAAIYIYRPEY